MANIFISHSSKDNQQTKDIFNTLQQIGDSLFLDFDGKHGLKGGNKWEKELYVRVKKARIMIVALSPNWLDSTWCYKEYCMARVLRKKIIPVVITADKRIASWDGNDIQHFDATIDPNAIEQLKERIAELTCHDISKIYDIKNIKSPFVGLRSFNKDEAGIFYGRNDEILDAIDKLNGMASSENQKFLNIIGASGVGKSSFLKAGILPLLELLHKDDWYVLPTFRAKQEFLLNLGKTFSFANGSKEILSQENTKTFFDAMEEQIYKECKSQNRKIEELKILFPIDQAEEILSSTNTQEREQFFKILQTLLEEKSNFFVVWTLRSDHLKKYQDEALLEFLHQQDETLLLKPIASKELKNIIQEPAYTADVHIEEAVVEEIKEDIRSTTSLPLLAHLLQTLYSKTKSKEKKQITLNDYKALSSEGRNPIENIINEQAEKIYKNIKDESLVQELFLNHLLKVNSDESVIKQSANLNAIPLKQQAIAEQFVAKRLFVKDGDGSEVATIEIAHEALISSWERLVNWIEAEKEFLLFRNHLELLYREWRESNEDERALLKDLNLEKALSFKSKLVREEEIGFVELSFEFEEKQRRKRRNFLLGVGGVISSLGVFSTFKWVEADKAKTIATKKTLEIKKEILKTKNMLYDATMERGFIYRDYQQKPLEAKHTFAKAVGQSSIDWQEKHSRMAYKEINDGLKLQNMFEHRDAVIGVKFSKDEKEILSWSNDKTVKLWSSSESKPLLILKHDGEVNGAEFSKDEKEILSWSDDGTVRLWEKNSDKSLLVLKNDSWVNGAKFSQNTKEILSWSDKTIKLWCRKNNKLLLILKHNDVVFGVNFSKDEKEILSWSGDGTVKLWGRNSSKPLFTLKHNSEVLGASFNKDETEILSWSRDGTVKLWGRSSNKSILVLKHNDVVYGAIFSQNEKEILSWSRDGTVKLWSRKSTIPLLTLKHNNGVNGVIFSQDEKEILTWSNKTLTLWNKKSVKPLLVFKHNEWIYGAEFNQNEKEILSWSSDGIVRLWSKNSDKELLILKHNREAFSTFFQDRTNILSWSYDGTIKLWKKKNNSQLFTLKDTNIDGIEFSQDETEILSWNSQGAIKLWCKNNDEALLILKHDGWINGVKFSQDEKEILSWSTINGTIKLWSRNSASLLLTLKHDNGTVLGVKFSQDEKEILSWSETGTIKLWNRHSNIPLLTLKHNNAIFGAIFSQDETKILSWSLDGTVKLWNKNSKSPLLVLKHNKGILGAKFTQDRKGILSWSSDGNIKLWNGIIHKLLFNLKHNNSIYGVIFSQDEKKILSWSNDGTVKLWSRETNSLLLILKHNNIDEVKFSKDETEILSWSSDGVIKLWSSNNDKPLCVLQYDKLLGAKFNKNETEIISWSRDGVVKSYKLYRDRKLPTAQYPLETEVEMGTELTQAGELRCLSKEEWIKKKKEYEKILEQNNKA